MRIKLAFEFDEEARLAIAHAVKCKRPATRTQVVQWLAGLVATAQADAAEALRKHRRNPDPNQTTIPGVLEDET